MHCLHQHNTYISTPSTPLLRPTLVAIDKVRVPYLYSNVPFGLVEMTLLYRKRLRDNPWMLPPRVSCTFPRPFWDLLSSNSPRRPPENNSATNKSITITLNAIQLFGMRTTSILTVSSVTATAAAAVALPFVGVLIDQSSHRKTVGALTAYCLVALNAAQVLLSQRAWPFFWLANKIFADFLYMIHSMVCLAFLKNLASNLNHLAAFASKFSVLHFGCTATYTAMLILYAALTHQEDIVQTSRVAHAASALLGFLLLAYAWHYLFGDRPIRRESKESLLQNTVVALQETLGKIQRHYPAFKRLS